MSSPNLPFGTSGSTPATSSPFGVSGNPFAGIAPAAKTPSSNGSLPFGTSKGGGTAALDEDLRSLPRKRNYQMPVVPTRFDPAFGRWGHYQLPSIENSRDIAYYPRVTTTGKVLESTEHLEKWKTERMFEGLARHAHVLRHIDTEKLAEGDREARDLVAKLSDSLREAYSGNAANFGNAVHAWTEAVDLGICTVDDVPAELRGHVRAYVVACREEGILPMPEFVERIIYNPYTGAAGRIDRIAKLADGTNVVLDVKTTKNLSAGVLAISVQLAQYATATKMLSEDGSHWIDPPDMSKTLGIVAHVSSDVDPEVGPVCELVDIDLEMGIENMMRAINVKESQSNKKSLVTGKRRRSLASDTLPPLPAEWSFEQRVWAEINAVTNPAEMADVFTRHAGTGLWTDKHTQWGKDRMEALGIDTSTM